MFQYIDDWLLLDRSPSAVLEMTRKFVDLYISQGMVVNLDKSHLSPTTGLVHLGTKWDFLKGKVAIPDYRVQSITEAVRFMLRNKRALIDRLESLMGLLVSCEMLVNYGRIHFRSFRGP